MEMGDLRQQYDEIQELIASGATEALRTRLQQLHPGDIADLLPRFEKEERDTVLGLLDAEAASEVIANVDSPDRDDILLEIDARRLSQIVDELPSNEAAEIISELPEEVATTVLDSMSEKESAEVKGLLGRKEDSAGRLMSTEIVKVDKNATVEEAVEAIRKAADEMEHVHFVYVVDADDVLLGVLPLRNCS